MQFVFCAILFFTLTFGFSEASKILLFHPSPSKSHVILTTSLAEELAERQGHQVTVVSPHSWNFKSKNLREIAVPKALPKFKDEHMAEMLKDGNQGFQWSMVGMIKSMMLEAFNETMLDSRVQKLIREEKFDLIIFGYFMNAYQVGLAAQMKTPYIVFTPAPPVRFTHDFTGEHSYPASVPAMFLGYEGKMTFKQRFMNFIVTTLEEIVSIFIDSSEEEIYNSFFPDRNRQLTFDEAKRNCSLMLVNHHFSQGMIRPYLPNSVEIGGIQIKEKPKPLPADLQKFMDEATDGVIVWTFGSNIALHQMPQDKKDAMFGVLGRLKQRVVIRWELDDKSVLPKNFYANKWLPQASLLAHKNTRLFITHGGAGGSLEALSNGVPIVSVPLFGDQKKNALASVNQGWAYLLDYSQISREDRVETAIKEVLTNPKYKNRVTELSNLYKDRLASSMDTAIYWVEYVIRHHGAPHLQYQGKSLNFFQSTSLDVLAFILVILYVVFKVTIWIFKKLFGLCFGSKKGAKKAKKE